MKIEWEKAWWDDRLAGIGDRETYKAVIHRCYDAGSVPKEWGAFLAFIGEIGQKIPIELQQHAMVSLEGSECDCGYNRASFEVALLRPENDEEYAARKEMERAESLVKKQAAAKAEKAVYERLKRKYGA